MVLPFSFSSKVAKDATLSFPLKRTNAALQEPPPVFEKSKEKGHVKNGPSKQHSPSGKRARKDSDASVGEENAPNDQDVAKEVAGTDDVTGNFLSRLFSHHFSLMPLIQSCSFYRCVGPKRIGQRAGIVFKGAPPLTQKEKER